MSVYCEPHALLHWAVRQEADWRIVWTRCGERIAIIGHPKNKPRNLRRCDPCAALSGKRPFPDSDWTDPKG